MPAVRRAGDQPRRRRFARRERRRESYLRLKSDTDGNLLHRVANAHELYWRLWNLENILENPNARRCVSHYAELWCLNQLPLILGAMALAAGTTNGGLVRVRNSSLSTLSMGLVNYNFQKTMKNNFTEFVEHHLGLWLLDYHSEELGEGSMRSYRNMPDLTSFVHKDVTPEFLFKQCDAYKAHRTSHTEFVCHDELAALAEQLGMMGDKNRACEKKHRQANMNELMDRGRLCREKLGQNSSSAADIAVLHRAMQQGPASNGGAPRVNLIIVASINVRDLALMMSRDSGSHEMASTQRFLFSTAPVFNAYEDPDDSFEVPDYLWNHTTAEPARDPAGFMRHKLRPPGRGSPDDILFKMRTLASRLGTLGKDRVRNPIIEFAPDAMDLFRWIDSACQDIAGHCQYADPAAAAGLRNVNRMLGKFCALFTLAMELLSSVMPAACLPLLQSGTCPVPPDNPIRVTLDHVTRATILFAIIECMNGVIFRESNAHSLEPGDFIVQPGEEVSRFLIPRVLAPQAFHAYVVGAIAREPNSSREQLAMYTARQDLRTTVLRRTLLWPGARVTRANAAHILPARELVAIFANYEEESLHACHLPDTWYVWERIVDSELVRTVQLCSWNKRPGRGRGWLEKKSPDLVRFWRPASHLLTELGVTMEANAEAFVRRVHANGAARRR